MHREFFRKQIQHRICGALVGDLVIDSAHFFVVRCWVGEAVHNAAMRLLEEIGVDCSNLLLVLNKVDQVRDRSMIDVLRRHYEDTITISAATGQGIDQLCEVVADRLSGGFATVEIETSSGNGKLLSWLTQHAQELDRSYTDETSARVKLKCRMAKQYVDSIDAEDTQLIILEPAVSK